MGLGRRHRAPSQARARSPRAVLQDGIYISQAASGNYQTGGLLDAAWPAAMLIVALAAWQKPEKLEGDHYQGPAAVAITSTFAMVGLAVLMIQTWSSTTAVSMVLAVLTVMAAFGRTAVTFGDMKALATGRQLMMQQHQLLEQDMLDERERSSRDPLTGLLNHREFHEGVRAEADRAVRDGSNFGVVLFDIDGFKGVNDDYGPPRAIACCAASRRCCRSPRAQAISSAGWAAMSSRSCCPAVTRPRRARSPCAFSRTPTRCRPASGCRSGSVIGRPMGR